jgi:hypothetical protein
MHLLFSFILCLVVIMSVSTAAPTFSVYAGRAVYQISVEMSTAGPTRAVSQNQAFQGITQHLEMLEQTFKFQKDDF